MLWTNPFKFTDLHASTYVVSYTIEILNTLSRRVTAIEDRSSLLRGLFAMFSATRPYSRIPSFLISSSVLSSHFSSTLPYNFLYHHHSRFASFLVFFFCSCHISCHFYLVYYSLFSIQPLQILISLHLPHLVLHKWFIYIFMKIVSYLCTCFLVFHAVRLCTCIRSQIHRNIKLRCQYIYTAQCSVS